MDDASALSSLSSSPCPSPSSSTSVSASLCLPVAHDGDLVPAHDRVGSVELLAPSAQLFSQLVAVDPLCRVPKDEHAILAIGHSLDTSTLASIKGISTQAPLADLVALVTAYRHT